MDGGSKEQRLTDFVVFVGIGFLIGFAWFKVYVEPREEFLMEVAECMSTVEDQLVTSNGQVDPESSYALCSNIVISNRNEK